MKLFSILIRHCSQKDSKEAIVGYFIAANDTIIMNYIDKELMSGIWTDRNNDSLDSPIEIKDEDDILIGVECYKERMLRLRGEFNDQDADYSDAYYGITHYGWNEGIEISKEQEKELIILGVAVNINESSF
ncbi:hypothetical protein GW796_08870 [archaeon]|nr:hypothetical protein [archaeon]NCQ51990.1 hypothetical protein [archaeon]